VRDGDGDVRVDREGRATGRGAYVCERDECAAAVATANPLARSFRAPVKVNEETIELIREWQRSASIR
jgi:predicted RNA-binding protein YlxR (DUF448 family)